MYNGALKNYKLEMLDSGFLQQSSASGIFWWSLFSQSLTVFKPITSLTGTTFTNSFRIENTLVVFSKIIFSMIMFLLCVQVTWRAELDSSVRLASALPS